MKLDTYMLNMVKACQEQGITKSGPFELGFDDKGNIIPLSSNKGFKLTYTVHLENQNAPA